MSAPVFFTPFGDDLPGIGETYLLTGTEGHHAVTVRRIGVGEQVVLADGAGRGVLGTVRALSKGELTVLVDQHLVTSPRPVRWIVAQALAKGDRGELAVEVLTEQGVDEVIPFSATRSMLRWKGERGAKGLARWRATAWAAAKQSRRLAVPQVSQPVGLSGLLARMGEGAQCLVLHEPATQRLGEIELAPSGEILLVVGPEGGLTEDEVATLVAAGAQAVRVSDGVLRTSTAGLVGLVQAQLIVNTSITGHR